MFEAQLNDGKILKQIIEAIKDLVTDCNLDCSDEEMTIQSMDSAHVSLVAVRLASGAFEHYRCDRPNTLGINTSSMSKIFKMLNNDGMVTLKAEDNADTLSIMFEGSKNETIADFGKSKFSRMGKNLHVINITIWWLKYLSSQK
jgi:proliferating cell nuclear antigen